MRKTILLVALSLHAAASLADDALTTKYACMKALKRSVHDPDSADFSEWNKGYARKSKSGNLWQVQIEFRAKNGFGALRKGVAECAVIVSKNGDAKAISVKQIR